MKQPSQADVKHALEYDAATGNLICRISRGRIKKGDAIGNVKSDGRLHAEFNGSSHSVHRLIWIYHNGAIPDGFQIDHIDRNYLNNKIENLRLATPSQNRLNSRKKKGALAKGVTLSKSTKTPYQAQITIDGSTKYLGSYSTLVEAHNAYKTEAIKRFGSFYCSGE